MAVPLVIQLLRRVADRFPEVLLAAIEPMLRLGYFQLGRLEFQKPPSLFDLESGVFDLGLGMGQPCVRDPQIVLGTLHRFPLHCGRSHVFCIHTVLLIAPGFGPGLRFNPRVTGDPSPLTSWLA